MSCVLAGLPKPLRSASVAILGAAAALGTAAPAVNAQRAIDILHRMQGVYRKAKTYQCMVRAHRTVAIQGKQGTYLLTQTIKMQMPNLLDVTQSITDGKGSMKALDGLRMIEVSDGRTFTAYNSKVNMYQQHPAPPVIPGQGAMQVATLQLVPSSVKLAGTTTVNGRPSYLLEGTLPIPPSVPAAQRAQIEKQGPLQMAIDRSTYLVLRVSQAHGKNAVDYLDQKLNQPIPPSVFRFTPPKGAKPAPNAPPPGPPGKR